MKNKTKIYAQALSDVILEKKTENKKIIANFLKLLEKSGLQGKAKEILALAEDLLLKKTSKKKIILETARKISAKQRKELTALMKDGDVIKEKINPEIIAGIKVIIDNERQFDASMLKNLQQIYEPRNYR